MSKAHPGSSHPNWKGGRRQMYNGYVEVFAPDHPNKNARNCIYEHRYVMEKHLNRYLLKNEQIHHKNKIRNDNRIENLELLEGTKHLMTYHRIGKDNPNYKDGHTVGIIRHYKGKGNGRRDKNGKIYTLFMTKFLIRKTESLDLEKDKEINKLKKEGWNITSIGGVRGSWMISLKKVSN